MSTTTPERTAERGLEMRVLREGYGTEEAWHGPDLAKALADVPAALAFWRPGPDRHNIAEIALHHAYCVRGVREKIAGTAPEPFLLEGDDWFGLDERTAPGWADIQAVVDAQHDRLHALIAEIGAGRVQSPLSQSDRFGLVLGITCHAVYHAGQIQLIKRLYSA